MPRKPVLEGGKRDEILDTAMKLFFENGYEATSVRMIMEQVGGEIGMFYHYFKSKDMLFDLVVQRFFQGYKEKFGLLLSECRSPEEFTENFLPVYLISLQEFERLKGNMHWTIQLSMFYGTLFLLRPTIISMLDSWNVKSDQPANILAGQFLYGISATVYTDEFRAMNPEEQKQCLTEFMDRVLATNAEKM